MGDLVLFHRGDEETIFAGALIEDARRGQFLSILFGQGIIGARRIYREHYDLLFVK